MCPERTYKIKIIDKIKRLIVGCLTFGFLFNINASDMVALIASPGQSLSFDVPKAGYFNDANDFLSFVKSRSSLNDNKHGYGILHYAHDRSFVNEENMWYLNDKNAYFTGGTSISQEPFYNAKEELVLSCSDNISSIIMAAANGQGSTLKSHPARFNYNGKTYSLILNGSSGNYPGPAVNRSYEYAFFRDAELSDENGTYKWFERYPSVWTDVDPYTTDTNFTFRDFPTGEITLNVIMYYLITENISFEDALKRALTDTHFGNGFEHTYGDSTYTSLDLKAHITDSNYAFTAIVSDGEKVYAFKSWKENDANKEYCQDFQIGYIQQEDFTVVTSIGEAGYYQDFQKYGLKLLGQYDLAVFDPLKNFNPETDIKHNFIDILPEGTIGDTSKPEDVPVKEVEPFEITISNPNFNLAWNSVVNASSEYGENYNKENITDTSENTVWASGVGLRNQWVYVKLGDKSYTVNDISVQWAGKYFAKRFRFYGHRGGDVSNLSTWEELGDEVTGYNTTDGVYTLSGVSGDYQYIGLWMSDLNENVFAIKELEVYGHKPVIEFPDENLQRKVLAALGKTELPIFKNELLTLKSLNVDGAPIELWQGISECENLEYLSAQWCKLESFPNLSNMVKLKTVDVSFNKLTDLSKFNSAPNLEKLYARRNEIWDIKPGELASLENLKVLDISENGLRNVDGIYYGIDGVEDLISLEFINFSGNPLLTNVNILNSLPNLNTVIGSGCGIVIPPVFNQLVSLKNLNISNNSITDITALQYNVFINYLDVNQNNLDISAGSDNYNTIDVLMKNGALIFYKDQK